MSQDDFFWPEAPALRQELHFGDRTLSAFADRPGDLDAMLAAAAAANPHGDAVICGSVRISHAHLRVIADQVAALLAAEGMSRGDRVGLLVGNRWEFVAALVGAVRAGIVVVPLSTRASPPELAYILDDCGAALTICEAELADRLPEGARRLAMGAGPNATADARDPFAEILAADPQLPAADAPSVPLAEEDLAVILYTSGTTGNPKGAMLTHLNIVHSCLVYRHCMRLSATDRTIVAVPASHVTGLIANVFALLGVGGAVVMMHRFEADAFLALATAERMTFTMMVPAMYNLCLLRADFTRHDLSHWRVGSFGGAPMPVATIERVAQLLPNLDLVQAYGATETTSPATIMPAGRQIARPASVGAPVPGADIRIMDSEGHEVPRGQSGEVWIGGPMVVPGYWNLPEKTAESFVDGAWRSGDVGRLDEAGYLFIHDRLKDMINRGGYKVFSAEVENVLAFHPGVAEVAVVPYPDPVLGEKVQAFVHRRDADIDETVLAAFCRERLADYKVPDRFVFTADPLPRNANGKLMKAPLREQARTDAGRDI
ncbi:acyl--CoA ligase [Aurantimonas sp. DM33-3]|uniref:AMP-binding protein n=1 Tax=Aurantimonas sp. DM33-3 TaxID=2766955 RepID=UPI001652006E|nr:acyl--CoA ligase [Aurantimonas sp. DM33-3]